MSVDEMWLRFFDVLVQVLGFSIIGSVVIWLLATKGRLGHRRMLWMIAIWCVLRCVALSAVAWEIYYHGQTKMVWTATISAVSLIVLALYISGERWHLKRTLTRTESADILRLEKAIDRDQKTLALNYLDEQSARESAAMRSRQATLIQ